MATEAEKRTLANVLGFAKGNPDYQNMRAQCMSGFTARSFRESREEGVNMPQAGEYCLELLKHSADVEADPKAKAARPDKELLGPYKAISKDKGLKPTEANALKLVAMYTQVANLPNIAPLQDAVKIPVGNPPIEFYLTQGSALDTAFTKTVLDASAGKGTPAPIGKPSAQDLAKVTDACFRNQGVSIGQCTEAGQEQAAIYLQGKAKKVAGR